MLYWPNLRDLEGPLRDIFEARGSQYLNPYSRYLCSGGWTLLILKSSEFETPYRLLALLLVSLSLAVCRLQPQIYHLWHTSYNSFSLTLFSFPTMIWDLGPQIPAHPSNNGEALSLLTLRPIFNLTIVTKYPHRISGKTIFSISRYVFPDNLELGNFRLTQDLAHYHYLLTYFWQGILFGMSGKTSFY